MVGKVHDEKALRNTHSKGPNSGKEMDGYEYKLFGIGI